MKNNKIILFSIFLSFPYIAFAGAGECSYKEKINKCIEANINGTAKSITDFICITSSNEDIAFQVILDEKFSKVDEKMDDYLFNLEENKSKYFGISKTKNYIDAINDIEKKSKIFSREFKNICSYKISKEVAECSVQKTVSNNQSQFYFNNSDCEKLADVKIGMFSDVAFNILLLNKAQIRADEKKLYDQKQRKKYNRLLDIMMINLGYLERIVQKWPMKLLNPL